MALSKSKPESTRRENLYTATNKEAEDAVVIVEYRTPNTENSLKSQEQKITELNAQVAYLQMMSGIEKV